MQEIDECKKLKRVRTVPGNTRLTALQAPGNESPDHERMKLDVDVTKAMCIYDETGRWCDQSYVYLWWDWTVMWPKLYVSMMRLDGDVTKAKAMCVYD